MQIRIAHFMHTKKKVETKKNPRQFNLKLLDEAYLLLPLSRFYEKKMFHLQFSYSEFKLSNKVLKLCHF